MVHMTTRRRSASYTQDAFFPRSVSDAMPTVVSGSGVLLLDDRGRELIDVCAGPFLASLGQGNARVIDAMARQARELSYVYARTTRTRANAEFSRTLSELLGEGYDRVHLTSGGSEANEMAIKMVRTRAVARGERDRSVVVTLMPSYHGATVLTLGYNGDDVAGSLWGDLTVEAERIPAPLTYRAPSPASAAAGSLASLDALIARVGPTRLLAVLVEPIGGQSSGVNVPDPSFIEGLRVRCDETGAALIFDEIVTAFRTGSVLAADHVPSARPDITTLAKGLGAGYAPLGATITSADFADELADTIGFTVSHSYDAAPISCAVGTAVVAEIRDRGLVAHAAEMGRRLRCGLDDLREHHPMIGDVRGRGLLLAIELVADGETATPFPAGTDPAETIKQIALEHGLLLYSRRQNAGRFGDWLLLAPPLIIDEGSIDLLLSRLDDTLAAATPTLNGALR